MIGTKSDTEELLDELIARAGEDPTSSFHKQMSYREIKRYLAALGDEMAGDDDQFGENVQDESSQQGHPYSKSEFFGRLLPTEAITALVENLQKGRIAGQSRELDFTPWGGAYNRVRADATAFVHRDELFLLKQAVVDTDASSAEREAARSWLARSWASTRPWGSGGVYQNFPDPDLEGWAHAYYGINYDRLVGVKKRYDPEDFFHFHQSLPSGR